LFTSTAHKIYHHRWKINLQVIAHRKEKWSTVCFLLYNIPSRKNWNQESLLDFWTDITFKEHYLVQLWFLN
jgi:hypothetical protein